MKGFFEIVYKYCTFYTTMTFTADSIFTFINNTIIYHYIIVLKSIKHIMANKICINSWMISENLPGYYILERMEE